MRKNSKLALIIFFSAILILLLINFVINYSNLLGNEHTYFYNFDQKYAENTLTYSSDKLHISFDYPASWSHTSFSNDNKTTETFTLDDNNNLSLSYEKLSKNEKSPTADTIINNSYSDMITTFTNNGYILDDNSAYYKNRTRIRYISFIKDDNYYNRYSWVTHDNYICEMVIKFQKSKYNKVKIIFDTIHFTDPDSLTRYNSNFSNLSFQYPNSFSTLGTFYNNSSNSVSESIIKNANTSMTINHCLIKDITENDFYDILVKDSENEISSELKDLGYSKFSDGTFKIDSTDFKYTYYKKDTQYLYAFYWYEKVGNLSTGNSIIFRFSEDDASDASTILRSFNFDSNS